MRIKLCGYWNLSSLFLKIWIFLHFSNLILPRDTGCPLRCTQWAPQYQNFHIHRLSTKIPGINSYYKIENRLCTLARSATRLRSGAVSRPRVVRCNAWDKMQVHTLTRSNQMSDCVRSDASGRIWPRETAQSVKSKRNFNRFFPSFNKNLIKLSKTFVNFSSPTRIFHIECLYLATSAST